MKKKKLNWLGFIALVVWDFGFIQYLLFSMGMTNVLLTIGSSTNELKSFFNICYIILLIILLLFNLSICNQNKWLITLGIANLIWYGVEYHFDVYPFAIIGCILLIIAGIFGLKADSKQLTTNEYNS